MELGWLDTVHSGPEPDGLRGDDAPRCRAGRQDARRDGWDHVKPDGAVLFSRKSYRECTQRQKAAVWLCEGCHTHQRTTSMLARRAGLCWLGKLDCTSASKHTRKNLQLIATPRSRNY